MDISEQLVGKGRQVLRLVEGLKVKLVVDDGESRITENHRVRCGAVFVVEFQAGYGCYGPKNVRTLVFLFVIAVMHLPCGTIS